MAKKADIQDRRARVAAMQAEAKRAERRRSVLIIGTAAGIAIAMLAWVATVVVNQTRQQDEVAAAAAKDIDGVQVFENLSRNHASGTVDYPQTPPVGGDHAAVWTNCGVYTSPVDPMQATHSLEHGAVWIGYDPALDRDQVETLTALAKANSYVVLSPVEEVPAPVTLSAWGVQLELDSATDPRLEVFVQKYQQGEQAPEPGAPCTGGVS